MANVTIYTSPTCSACQSAKQFFKEKNIAYSEIDIAKNEAKAQEIVKKAGQSAVPIIDINGKVIVGFNQKEISSALGIS